MDRGINEKNLGIVAFEGAIAMALCVALGRDMEGVHVIT